MYIVMLGKPGPGKGTVGRMLSEQLGVTHVSSGDLFRGYIKKAGEIGENTIIRPNTTIKSDVVIGKECEIGPNSYIREGCRLSDRVKIGSFGEIKKAIVGEGTKIPHLSYMGDLSLDCQSSI